MRDLTRDNFGLLIAYVLPGFVTLWGAAYHIEAVRPWLQSTAPDAPTIGGFLYATLASTALGLIVVAVIALFALRRHRRKLLEHVLDAREPKP